MALEDAINANTEALKTLITILQSGAAMTAGATTEAPKPPPASRAKASNSTTTATPPAPTPAPAEQPKTAAPAPAPTAGPTWAETLSAMRELQGSDKLGAGREGVMKVLNAFGLDGKSEGQKVPGLEAKGKNAEIIKMVRDILDAPAAAPASEVDEFGM